MKPIAAEWVAKAEGDYATARRELRARKQPNFDAVCFHAQQCAEKYLKGLLQEQRLVIPRTHNLDALAKPLLEAHNALTPLAADLRTLGGCRSRCRPNRRYSSASSPDCRSHFIIERAITMEIVVGVLMVVVALVFVGIALDAARPTKDRR